MDQAQKLRELIEQLNSENDSRVIAVSSGKGGVGKTNFSVNLSIALSKMDKRVTIIDADLGLSNVDVLFGIMPKYSLQDVLNGRIQIQDMITTSPTGVNIVSGGSGINELVDIGDLELEKLIMSLGYFNSISDFLIIDTGAGIGKSVLSFVASAQELVVMVNPDPTSITDSYALIKSAAANSDIKVYIVVNRVESNREGDQVFEKLRVAADKFLHLEVENLGYIFEDQNLRRAVRKQIPVLLEYPRSVSSKGIENIAFNIVHGGSFDKKKGSFKSFMKRLFNKL